VSRATEGGLLVGSAAVAALVLSVQDVTDGPGFLTGGTLYPVVSWVFAVVLGLAGLFLLLRPGDVAAGVGAVAALQLGGIGAVAFKHWKPYMGMAGTFEHLAVLRALAALLALVAAVSAAVCVRALVTGGAFPVRAPSRLVEWSAVVVGLALLLGVPVLVGAGDPQTLDVSSLGAYALLYAVPWGMSVAASGWLTQRAAVAVLVTVLASTVLVATTKPMVDIVFDSTTTPVIIAAGSVLVALLVRVLAARLQKVQPLSA